MGAEVIKEFLVSLGYKVEAGQERKFKDSVGSATTAVIALGTAAAATASAVTAAVVKISRSFDNLYWQAQRTQTTVAQIRAISYAASQLGGSADEASASIEAFGKNLKWNVGFEGFLKQLGVVTRSNGQLRDSVSLLRDFANVLKGRSKTEQMGLAQVAGIDLRTLEAIQRGDFQRHLDEYAAKVRALGVDEDKASEKGRALQQSMRSLEATLAAVGVLLLDKFGPALAGSFDKIEEFVQNNGDKFIAAFEKLAKVAGELAEIFGKIIDVLGPIWEGFDKLTQSLTGYDGLTVALTALIALKVAPWLTGIAAAILSVGTAANTALLGGALAKFFGLLGVAAPVGAFALGMSPTDGNAGENEAIARRRAAGTFGPASPGDLDADAARRQKERQRDTSLWGRVKRWWNGGGVDPANGASVAPKGSAAKMAAAREAYDFWRSKGLSHEAAAGLVANEEAESGFNPAARGDGGRAHGLFQHHPDRRAAILAGTGIDMSTADAKQQREAAHWEMTKGQERKTWNMLQGVTSAGEAGAIVSREYERPADRAGEASKRAAAANGWAARFAEPAAQSSTGSGAAEAYRRKTGRDLNADLNSGDKYVGEWAAKEAGLTPNSGGDGGSVRMMSPQEREREADRQTDMGRVQAYEDAIAQAGANVGKIGGGGLGGNGAALTPPPGSTAGTTVTVNQENHVSVTGSGDPHDTAQQIGNTQRDVNAGMVRDLKGAVR